MAAAANAAFGDFTKEPLYEIEPTGTGGSEVDSEPMKRTPKRARRKRPADLL
jgi:hypothetical protein